MKGIEGRDDLLNDKDVAIDCLFISLEHVVCGLEVAMETL